MNHPKQPTAILDRNVAVWKAKRRSLQVVIAVILVSISAAVVLALTFV